jgi:outer membrane protein assembly factor BamB
LKAKLHITGRKLLKRIVSGIMLILLLIGMLTLAFNILTVKSESTTTVDDGTIENEHARYENYSLKNSAASSFGISPVATLFVPFTLSPPTLDGSIEPIEWEDAIVNTTILVNTTLYLMHDSTNIYIGWHVLDNTRERDYLIIYFEEGDDGAFGSGSSDRQLKNNQEDTKYISSGTDLDPMLVRADGYCTGGDSWVWSLDPTQIDFNGTMQFYGDHYEAEFAVPFKGVEGKSQDKSDLVCTPADVIAFRIEYMEGHTASQSVSAWYDLCFLHPNGDAPPQWRNQKQSALVIPQGGCVSLQAEGMDAVSLSRAVLSTNETGIWRNETEYAFLWRQDAVWGFDNFGTATYEDGVLYAPSKGDNNVYAIDASNGDIVWNRTIRQCDASPCIDGGVIYVGECCGSYGEPTPFPRAMTLNKTTGEEVWRFIEPNNFTWVGSPLVHGDYVYYTTLGSGVYALNKTDGTPIWHQDIGDVVCSVAYHNGMVFVSAHDPPGQYAFNATTGEEVWHQNYGASWDSSPVIYEEMVIQVTRNTITGVWSTYVLNETNGELMQKFEGEGSPSTPLVHGGKILIPDDDWRLWAFDLLTGDEVWHTVDLHDGTLQDYSYCSPAAAGGAIYYQSLNGTFYVINETDGGILWSFTLGDYGFGSPSIGDGCVFITNDFALYAFKIGPGSGDWPMFCQNNFHFSYSKHGIEYVRWPLTQPKDFKDSSNMWLTAKFTWCNKTITSTAIAWRIYFFDDEGNTNATDTKIFYIKIPTPLLKGPYYTWYGVEYWILVLRKHAVRLISNYY